MGIDHYVLCKKCEVFMFLGKWYRWDGFSDNHPPGCISGFSLEINDPETVLRFMNFFKIHSIHEMWIGTEDEELLDDYTEVMDFPKDRLIIPPKKELKLFGDHPEDIIQLWEPDTEEDKKLLEEYKKQWKELDDEIKSQYEKYICVNCNSDITTITPLSYDQRESYYKKRYCRQCKEWVNWKMV